MKLITLASESFAAKLCLSANSIRQETAGIWKRLLGVNTKSHSVPTPVGHRRFPKMPFSFICAMVAERLGKKQICGALFGTLETNDRLWTFTFAGKFRRMADELAKAITHVIYSRRPVG